jgi:hypothetical protein
MRCPITRYSAASETTGRRKNSTDPVEFVLGIYATKSVTNFEQL